METFRGEELLWLSDKKFHNDDVKSVWNQVRSTDCSMEKLHCLSYCLWMKDKIQKATTEECKRHEYKQNSQYLWNIIILLQKKHLSFSEACLQQMNTTILIKINWPGETYNWTNLFFVFGTPWPPDLLCKHWFTSSVWNFIFCLWVADIHPCENIQWRGVRRNGCFCRLHLFSVQRGIQPKMRPTHLIFVSKCWSASEAKGFCNSFCVPVAYAPR